MSFEDPACVIFAARLHIMTNGELSIAYLGVSANTYLSHLPLVDLTRGKFTQKKKVNTVNQSSLKLLGLLRRNRDLYI